jgi:hypothetical protein
MKLIAHRGNIDGSNPLKENHPDYIDEAISKGYDVEIDVRYNLFESNFCLGHDEEQYDVSPYWLAQRMDHLWIHCKNIDSLFHFTHNTEGYNYFWHQEDDYTLTSKGYIWTYPGNPYTYSSIIVMPETHIALDNFSQIFDYECFGICSDYVNLL